MSRRPPRDVDSEPAMASGPWGMLLTVLAVAALTAPILVYVAAHASLTEWEYELTRLQRLESQEKERESRLSVALAEATAPDRIRREALAIGLRQYQATEILRLSGQVRSCEASPSAPPESPGLGETLERTVAAAMEWAGLAQGGGHLGY